jgi:hypothetical protein
MTTTKETCPKCGKGLNARHQNEHSLFVSYLCGTKEIDGEVSTSTQSARCRITELEKENERLREAMIGLRQQIGCGCGSGDLASLCKTCRVADYNASTLLAKGGKTE